MPEHFDLFICQCPPCAIAIITQAWGVLYRKSTVCGEVCGHSFDLTCERWNGLLGEMLSVKLAQLTDFRLGRHPMFRLGKMALHSRGLLTEEGRLVQRHSMDDKEKQSGRDCKRY